MTTINHKEEMSQIKITMPPNATPKQVKEHTKTFMDIFKFFAKLTGEDPNKIKVIKIKEGRGR